MEELRGVVRAQRVDAAHVVEQVAPLHGGGHRVLVEEVAARDLRAALRHGCGGGVGPGERDDVVTVLSEAGEQRAADQPAPAGEEHAAHCSDKESEKRLK